MAIKGWPIVSTACRSRIPNRNPSHPVFLNDALTHCVLDFLSTEELARTLPTATCFRRRAESLFTIFDTKCLKFDTSKLDVRLKFAQFSLRLRLCLEYLNHSTSRALLAGDLFGRMKNLQHLVLGAFEFCTDQNLEVIANRCQKLESLEI